GIAISAMVTIFIGISGLGHRLARLFTPAHYAGGDGFFSGHYAGGDGFFHAAFGRAADLNIF
ncbi:hypothetical protein LTSEADE_0899, partial [Salmonella enterica subsp. enterica serovar Adelaide str. A4-669]